MPKIPSIMTKRRKNKLQKSLGIYYNNHYYQLITK